MSLEDALKENTLAVNALTAAIKGSGALTAAPAKPTSISEKLDAVEKTVGAAPAKTDGAAAAIAKAKAAKAAKEAKEAPAAVEATATFPDYAKVRELVMEVAAPDKANRRDLVLEALAEFEVKQAQELKPEQREEFMKYLQAKLDEALAGAALA